MLDNYLADLKASLTTSPIIREIEILDEFITSVSGYFECKVVLNSGAILYITEYFTIEGEKIKRDKYSYHAQENDTLLTRWDNAPHHKEISTFPYHVHSDDGISESKDMTHEDVLNELSERMD